MKKVLYIVLLNFLVLHTTTAQSLDFLRSTGKIYSVVAVVVIIFLGITLFLYRLDTKLTKIEKHIKNEQ